MTKWTVIAIFFTLFSFGALKESFRIFTSDASDIASNRMELKIMAVILTSIILVLTMWFWRKATTTKTLKRF